MPDEANDVRSPQPLLSPQEASALGVIVEVNRRVLHPVGLALAWSASSESFCILDDRGDPEGWIYGTGDDAFAAAVRDRSATFAAMEAERHPSRQAALGYVVQPLP